MANWFHRFFNPHCEHCAEERQRELICDSCDTLKEEVHRLRSENQILLNRILEKPEPVPDRLVAPEPQAPLPRPMNWAVRRQMLEAEDREKARLMSKAPKPSPEIEEIERELGVDNAIK